MAATRFDSEMPGPNSSSSEQICLDPFYVFDRYRRTDDGKGKGKDKDACGISKLRENRVADSLRTPYSSASSYVTILADVLYFLSCYLIYIRTLLKTTIYFHPHFALSLQYLQS